MSTASSGSSGATLNGGYFNSFTIFEQHEGGAGVASHNGPLDAGTAYLRLVAGQPNPGVFKQRRE